MTAYDNAKKRRWQILPAGLVECIKHNILFNPDGLHYKATNIALSDRCWQCWEEFHISDGDTEAS